MRGIFRHILRIRRRSRQTLSRVIYAPRIRRHDAYLPPAYPTSSTGGSRIFVSPPRGRPVWSRISQRPYLTPSGPSAAGGPALWPHTLQPDAGYLPITRGYGWIRTADICAIDTRMSAYPRVSAYISVYFPYPRVSIRTYLHNHAGNGTDVSFAPLVRYGKYSPGAARARPGGAQASEALVCITHRASIRRDMTVSREDTRIDAERRKYGEICARVARGSADTQIYAPSVSWKPRFRSRGYAVPDIRVQIRPQRILDNFPIRT